MRVGVKDAVLQHHLDVHLGQRRHQRVEPQLARREPLLQPVDPGALDVLQHQHPPPHQVGHDLRHHHLRLGGEVPLQRGRVAGLLAEVQLVGDPLGELAHDRGDRADLMAGKEQVQEEEDPERDVEVAADHLLDAGPQHLHHDLAPPVRRAMDLAQRRGGERLGIEPVEDAAGLVAQLAADHRLRHARRQRRHLVGQGADGGEIGLGQDVGPRGEDLRQLDEGGAEIGDGAGEPRGPPAVALVVPPRRAAEQDEAPAVPEEGEDERERAG